MEGPDHRRPGAQNGVPAEGRRDRLVYVDHVEVSVAKLATHGRHRVREDGEV